MNSNNYINSLGYKYLTNIYVDDDAAPSWYDATHVATIYEGINNATNGDIIYIYNGTYDVIENGTSNKNLTIIGNSSTGVHIDIHGSNGLWVEGVINCSVNVSNLNFYNGSNSKCAVVVDFTYSINTNCRLSNLIINSTGSTKYLNCIEVDYIGNITIDNCTLSDAYDSGILLMGEGTQIVENCTFSRGLTGILGSGIWIGYGDGIIKDCVFFNGSNGISIDIDNVTIFGNRFYNVTNATYLWGYNHSNDFSAYNNYFASNTSNYISTYQNNKYLLNLKFNTTQQIGTNIIGGPFFGGNYWSNYTGADTNGDGFGDTPLLIISSSNGQIFYDYLPLVGFLIPQFISIEYGTNGTFIYTTNPTINWTKVNNTSQYWLQISKNNDFSDLAINLTNITECLYLSNYVDDGTNISFKLPNWTPLIEYRLYYMRVKAYYI